ncbi:MAG: YcxB family protein, partial [Clostridia bacterium]|nr:YcxB family protein [Clostridia bacterium]
LQVHKELNKKVFAFSILYIVAGAMLLALGIIIYVLSGDFYVNSSGNVMSICGMIILAGGIVILSAVRSAKNSNLKYQKVDEAEFFRDHFMAYEYTDGELTTTSKIYYNRIIRIKETANYLFLYNTKATAIAVDKNSLPLSELNTVRMLLGRPVAGAAQDTVQVPDQTENENKEE